MSDFYFDDITAARTFAASFTALPEVAALLAEDDDALAALLLIASIDIDHAMPYQGAKFDATGAQPREFPRWANTHDRPALPTPANHLTGPHPGHGLPIVWDWDADNDAAIVPDNVKLATLLQAAHDRADPAFAERMEAIRSGLTGQSIGSWSESYDPAATPGGPSGLCDRAHRLMERYRLRSGALR